MSGFFSSSHPSREVQIYSRRRRRSNSNQSIIAATYLLLVNCAMPCSSHPSIGLFRKRRRNNTGFYYGLRDDDMNFAHNHGRHECGWDVLSRASATPFRFGNHQVSNDKVVSSTTYDSVQHLMQYHAPSQCSEQHIEKSQNDLLIANEDQTTHRKKALQSLSKSLVNSVMQKLQQQPIPSNRIFNEHPSSMIQSNNPVVQIAVQSKSKHQKSRKKRRKNNTGFYYGIREDVLVLPEQIDESPSTKINTKKKSFAEEHSDISFHQTEHSPPAMPQPQRPADFYRGNSFKEKKQNSPKTRSRGLSSDDKAKKKKIKRNISSQRAQDESNSGIFDETLQELREMKDEIIALREELRSMKGEMHGGDESIPALSGQSEIDEKPKWWARPSPRALVFDTPPDSIVEPLQIESIDEEVGPQKISPRMRRREFEQIGRNVETWACRLLFDQESAEEDGWKEIECNKFCRKKFNSDGKTKVYLKWMPDSRIDNDSAENSGSDDDQEYPCIKCYSTINAPMEKVCSFLSNENTIPDYNELIEDYCDIEEISPHSKITWCKMPKIMFVKSRDFVTYCSHRWWRDGTQVIVNQACEHSDKPGTMKESEGDACRGYALRGANFISQDPNDPKKTRITLLAHANPGGGMPQWAMTTAVNAAVQIEPFKLFHKINQGASNYNEPSASASSSQQLATVNSLPGRSDRPAGMAQMGYACFWPDGGGLREKSEVADLNN